MKQITLIIFVVITLGSCKKDREDIPNYKPGRLTEISDKNNIGEPYHRYEYKDNEVVDKYYYSLSYEVLTMKYHFNNDRLEKVFYSFLDTIHFQIDSLIYIYSKSQIIEYTYSTSDSPYKRVYFLEKGKIRYSIEEAINSRIDSSFYTWSGDNLVGIEVHNWYYGESPRVTKYEFQYSEIENPLFYSNIPKLEWQKMEGFTSGNELSDLIPNCSRNFPTSLSISNDLYTVLNSFESKKFQNFNIPYEVSTTSNSSLYGDYSFIYEKL